MLSFLTLKDECFSQVKSPKWPFAFESEIEQFWILNNSNLPIIALFHEIYQRYFDILLFQISVTYRNSCHTADFVFLCVLNTSSCNLASLNFCLSVLWLDLNLSRPFPLMYVRISSNHHAPEEYKLKMNGGEDGWAHITLLCKFLLFLQCQISLTIWKDEGWSFTTQLLLSHFHQIKTRWFPYQMGECRMKFGFRGNGDFNLFLLMLYPQHVPLKKS